ncbi:TetR/AcrR family transcriptional regulator [Nocardiopsis sp. NPDC101807]|uniref:TetR/AcrR family transcriptional regulator n=1 Tax=Nocardiopsis sp. NPDC101807 TaxID=3364339 RepID=UPI003802E92F
MGRPRTFDEDRVLEAACRLFWSRGYEATSTEDLCTATGLTRSSLYNAFTSKEHLFRRALARYMATMTARQSAILDAPGTGLARLRSLLEVVVADEIANREKGVGPGCFTVNTVTEIGESNPRVAEIVRADLEKRLASLRLVAMEGVADGSMAAGRDPAGTAWYVNALVSGIRVSAQAGADGAALEAIASVGLAALAARPGPD